MASRTAVDVSGWQLQVELSLLGAFLQLCWAKALGAVRSASEAVRARQRAELAW